MDFEQAEAFSVDYEERSQIVNGMMVDFLGSGLKTAKVNGWEKWFGTLRGAYMGLSRAGKKFGIAVSQKEGNLYIIKNGRRYRYERSFK